MDNHNPAHDINRRILWIALALNFSLFVLEIWQGFAADSTALLADATDFASDCMAYIIALFVLSKPLRTRAKAGMFNGSVMVGLSSLAIIQGVHHLISGDVPNAYTMGWVQVLALIANLATAMLLYKSRNQDSNMRAVWLCSRNDAIANVGIMIAAVAVYYTQTLWPDLGVALLICFLEGKGGLEVVRHARQELSSAA